MKTLGLCLPKDRSKVMAPCPITPEKFGSDSLKGNEEDYQGDNTFIAEEAVTEETLDDSQESFKKFSLDSGKGTLFKSDNRLCNGYTNTHETTKDMILSATKLTKELIETPMTAPTFSLNVSHALITNKSGEVQVSSKNNHAISKPFSSSSRSGKTCKRPSLEYLVARLHNRVEETKSATSILNKHTFPTHPVILQDDSKDKTGGCYRDGEKSDFPETKLICSNSTFFSSETTETYIPFEKKIGIEAISPTTSQISKLEDKTHFSMAVKSIPVVSNNLEQYEDVKNKVEDNIDTPKINEEKYNVPLVPYLKCNKSESFTLDKNEKDESLNVKSVNKLESDYKCQDLHNATKDCSTFAQSFCSNCLKCKNVDNSCNKHSTSKQESTVESFRPISNDISCTDSKCVSKSISQEKINFNTTKDGAISKPLVLSSEFTKSLENINSTETTCGKESIQSTAYEGKQIETSTDLFSRENNFNESDAPNLKEKTNIDKVDSIEESKLKTINTTKGEISSDLFRPQTTSAMLVPLNEKDSDIRPKPFIDSHEKALVENFKNFESKGDKVIGEDIEDLEDEPGKGERGVFDEKPNTSNSSTPMFSNTSSDASQSDIMVKISDAVAALLEKTNGKTSDFATNKYEMKDDGPNKLFSNSNSPIDYCQSDINFTSALKILDLLQENSETRSNTFESQNAEKNVNVHNEQKTFEYTEENAFKLCIEEKSFELSTQEETTADLHTEEKVIEQNEEKGVEADDAKKSVEQDRGLVDLCSTKKSFVSYSQEKFGNLNAKRFIEQDNEKEVIEQDSEERVIEQDGEEEVVKQDNKEKVAEQDDKERVVEHDKERIVEQDDKERVVEQDDKERVVEQDDKERVVEQDDKERVVEQDDKEKVIGQDSEEKVIGQDGKESEQHSKERNIEQCSEEKDIEQQSKEKDIGQHSQEKDVEQHNKGDVEMHNENEVAEQHNEERVVEQHNAESVVGQHNAEKVIEQNKEVVIEQHNKEMVIEQYTEKMVIKQHNKNVVIDQHTEEKVFEPHWPENAVKLHIEERTFESESGVKALELHNEEIIESLIEEKTVAAYSEENAIQLVSKDNIDINIYNKENEDKSSEFICEPCHKTEVNIKVCEPTNGIRCDTIRSESNIEGHEEILENRNKPLCEENTSSLCDKVLSDLFKVKSHRTHIELRDSSVVDISNDTENEKPLRKNVDMEMEINFACATTSHSGKIPDNRIRPCSMLMNYKLDSNYNTYSYLTKKDSISYLDVIKELPQKAKLCSEDVSLNEISYETKMNILCSNSPKCLKALCLIVLKRTFIGSETSQRLFTASSGDLPKLCSKSPESLKRLCLKSLECLQSKHAKQSQRLCKGSFDNLQKSKDFESICSGLTRSSKQACLEDTSILLEGASNVNICNKDTHNSSLSTFSMSTHPTNVKKESDSLSPGLKKETANTIDDSVLNENIESKCAETEVNELHVSLSSATKDIQRERNCIGTHLTNHHDKKAFLRQNIEIITPKYIDLVLNRECNYYSSLLKLRHQNFNFLNRPIYTNYICESQNFLTSNTSATILPNNNKLQANSSLQTPESTTFENKMDIHEPTLQRKTHTGPYEEDSFVESIKNQNTLNTESYLIYDKSVTEIREENNSNSQVEFDNIGGERSFNKVSQEEEQGQELSVSIEEHHSPSKLKDLYEFTSQDIHTNFSDKKAHKKYNFLEFLKLDKVLIAGECILCKSSHKDLSWHASQLHTCISYIPIYQSDAYIHHLRERIGLDIQPYSDSLYGNPLCICKCCNVIFKTMDSVRIHLNTHKDIYMIQSSSEICTCHKTYFSFPHQKLRALLFQSEFVCSFCNYLFGCKNGLINHLKVVHFHERHCQICKYEIDIENDTDLMEHNLEHLNKEQDSLVHSYEENIEPQRDQTYFSWNALDNHLNYLDGKVFRLDALKELNKRPDRKYLNLPMTVDPSYAIVPDNMCLSPTPEMAEYINLKMNSKLIGKELDSYASKVLDLPVQLMLQKKFSYQKKKKERVSISQRVKKITLPMYLELNGRRRREKLFTSDHSNERSVLPTRCMYSRKAKTKIQKKQPKPKQVKITEDESILKPSRTRSGIKTKEIVPESEFVDSSNSSIVNTSNELSGEWVNYHTYVCCACGAVFIDLADIMDHKWEAHPGVWCAHTMIHGQEKVPKMFYQQYLPAQSLSSNIDLSSFELKTTKSKDTAKDHQFLCTQCKTKFATKEALHFHIIDCGGLNQIVTNKKKNKKGIRFRRRKGQGIPSRRYGLHSIASTPQKHLFDRGSGMSTPSKESCGQHVAASATSSSNVVKRRLELAIGSIENSKLKSKLEAILSRQRTGSSSRRQNLRRRLRKKRLHQKRTRITRHSEANKESRSRVSIKEEKKTKENVDKQKGKKEIEMESLENKSEFGSKRVRKGKTQQLEKTVKKKSLMLPSQEDMSEPVEAEVKSTIKGSSLANIEKRIKKFVPFTNKKEKRKVDPGKQRTKDISASNLEIKNSELPHQESKSRISVNNLDAKKDKNRFKKLKSVLQTQNAPKLIRKVKDAVLMKGKKERFNKCVKKRIRATSPPLEMSKTAILPKDKPKVIRTRVITSFLDDSSSKDGKSDSESASEPEVIRNFRRKRLIGRAGLRTRKNQEFRYSLRPTVSVSQCDKSDDDDDTDDDDEEDVIGKPRRSSSRRYNIGDDDDDALEEAKNSQVTVDIEDDVASYLSGKKKIKSVSRRGSTEDGQREPCSTFRKEVEHSSARRKPISKASKSRMSRFYFLAQKNLARLKANCQNTDSESSSVFEGFSRRRRKANSVAKPLTPYSAPDLEDSANSKSEVKIDNPALLQRVSVVVEKADAMINHEKCDPPRKRLRRKPSKAKKRKLILTPEIVQTDSESDSSSEDPKRTDALLASKLQKEKSKPSNEKVLPVDTAAPTPEPNLATVTVNEPLKNKRKTADGGGNLKRRRSKASIIGPNEIDHGKETRKTTNQERVDSINVSSSFKSKMKTKRKYTFKKRLLSDAGEDVPTPKSRNKKILKEVRVLSYKSLNTRESILTPQKDEKEEISQEMETKKKKTNKKRLSNADENSPTVASSPRKRRKVPSASPQRSNKGTGEVQPDSIGFLCIDCGLSFDSALSREDHRQDCRNIAFEMSLMAEDHLYECPYCQLTFALRGTQRKHIISCRMSRSRKYSNRRKRQSNKGSKAAKSLLPADSDQLERASASEEVPPLPVHEETDAQTVENSATENDLSEEPEIEVMGTRLATYCREFVGVKEVCALMMQFKFCTNDLRSLLTAASAHESRETTVIRVDPANLPPPPPSAYAKSNYETLQNLLKRTTCLGLTLVFNNTVQRLLRKENENGSESSVITLEISRPEFLQALSSVEELLKEVSQFDSFLKKEQMLLAMKHTFQAGTGS